MSEGNGYATKDALFAMNKRRFREVKVAGQVFRIRSLTERERSEYETSILTKSGQPDPRKLPFAKARLLVKCLVDKQGDLLLQEADVHQLLDLDSQVTNTLWDAAREHTGVSDQDLEELVKNSDGVPAESSPTS